MPTTCPAEAQHQFDEANRLLQQGDLPTAEAHYKLALAIAPDEAAIWANLALLQERKGEIADAVGSYSRALALQPANTQIYLNLGVLLLNHKRFDDAELAFRQALELSPASAPAWSNLGVLWACLKREDEAEACYRHALNIDPHYARARFNLSYVLMRQGRFEEGWMAREARSDDPLGRYFQCPRWQGEEIAGKSIIIGFEAGFGDMLQFCRYATLLKAHGATRVSLVCHPPLKTLLQRMPTLDAVYGYDEAVPPTGHDYWCPPMSLPLHFATRLDNIPHHVPYLFADALKAAQWQDRLVDAGPRVGLVWQGNAAFENDQDRSMPALDILAPVLAVPGIQFVSLQKGPAETAQPAVATPAPLWVAGPELQSFDDTAALIANLDLVITVDTAVAHLAGAMGKPCWVLLPDYRPDWRWLTERTDSPWYPTMTLYRQTSTGDWQTLVHSVAQDLHDWLQTQPARGQS
ncbi:tetratricopeptide repeat protein [Silvimonas iriomotensis]|uniref:Tetratricopeptide repeat protein n=1 Tax=Silvimonas iriomotensis TaxID=449662 RepID=A0ABQ2P582_9NEIS|nr:tetratricopeptide repeat protein [Silvimonas iriomotensis]GGP18113.1 hypothetical protein GCM10010970_03240 [Silvimonas iriomotensis]